MRAWPSDQILLGGDYNPEQWPRETWREDITLMQRAGVGFVTLGVFSWSWLEPREGEYEFEWLDEVMGLLDEAGIVVDLATGTAAPPVWFSQAYPDSLPIDHEGRILHQGSRQAYCPSSITFRDKAVALTRQMATRYHDHPALAMWHVSNEYGCHNIPCYCDRCAVAFRGWLEDRYGTVEAMNDAWGTAFWSQRYLQFDHVLPPRRTPTFHNPGQVLDYRRFQSDQTLAQYLAEATVLKALSPGVPVTTNFMTMTNFRHLDYYRWAPELDVVSTDHYVVESLSDPTAELSFCGALTRGVAGGAPWLLMEHSTSAVNWQPVNPAKPAGKLLRDSLTHVAHGSDMVGYFQWRASRAGAEKYHSAMLPHAGPETKRFAEVTQLGDVLARIGAVAGSRVESQVAILFDFEAQWAAAGPAMPSELVDYPATAVAAHRALRQLGISADVVAATSNLDSYDVVVVPTLYLATDETAAAIAQVSERGGQVVVSYFSGIVDEHDHIRLGGYPGAFRELLGVRVEEFFPLGVGEDVRLSGDLGTATVWSEDLSVTTADVVASYADGPLAGQPAITRRQTGAGAAWYVSTELSHDGWVNLLGQVTADAGVQPVAKADPGIELIRRRNGSRSWLFAINATDQAGTVTARGRDLVADRDVASSLQLPPGAVAVIEEAD